MDVSQIVAQTLGIVAVVLGFISYQVKTDKKLLFVNALTCAVFSVHYYLLGAIPAAVLNGVGVVRNIVYYYKDKSFYKPKLFPVLFAVIMLALGIYSANGVHSVLVVAGLVINTVCLSFKSAQNVRKSVLITCPMVLIYDTIEHSFGGVVYESVAIVSAVIGIVRYRKTQGEYITKTSEI